MFTSQDLKEANALTRRGAYVEALELYRRILQGQSEIESSVRWNIAYAEAKLAAAGGAFGVLGKIGHVEDGGGVPQEPTGKPLAELIEETDRQLAEVLSSQNVKDGPLVSVVMTTHNSERYVEEALESLFAQSYRNLEIIVVDDCSEDRTLTVLHRVARSHGRLKIFALNTSLGTYFAKNLGVQRSQGEVVFFQDSDDISHPHRISACLQKLLESRALAVRCAYSRFDSSSGRVIEVNGLASKLGLITLGVRRKVFRDLGFFNCTTKASDDEFYSRVVALFGRKSIVDVPLSLYYALTRAGSLFSDMVHQAAGGSIVQRTSPARAQYVSAYSAIHKAFKSPADAAKLFAFPRIRDAIPVPSEFTKLSNPDLPVIFNVCSIPERREKLERVLGSVVAQCDEINIYLDRYNEVPDFLSKLPVPVNVVTSSQRPGLRDNGKFLALDRLASTHSDAYYFTIDDDIEYPPDYVNSMIRVLDQCDGKVAVGVHGVILRDAPEGYFSDRRMVYLFTKSLESNRLVNVLGTGTLAFRASMFPDFRLKDFEQPGMADIYFAHECRARGVPMVCISRPDHWLRDLGSKEEPTLFEEFKGDDRRQLEVLRRAETWGYSGISSVVSEARLPANVLRWLQGCIPALRSVTSMKYQR